MPTQSHLIETLTATLGTRGITTDAEIMAPLLTDWRGTTHGRAAALVMPATTAEVQAIVRLAAAASVPITVQGGNSGMVAGATPPMDGAGLLMSLRRMNTIRHIDGPARSIIGEAGVILADLHDAADRVGCRFPLTLGGKGSAMLGGLIATNAGGTQVLRHGTMRALTLGVEVVQPDGSVFDLLAPLAKDNRGPDLKQLYIGSEGCFGIITAATLKLAPAIVERCVAWVHVASPDDALSLLRVLTEAVGDALEGFEIMPAIAVDHVVDYLPDAQQPINAEAPWHLLLEAVGHAGDAPIAARLVDALTAAQARGLISNAAIASSEAQADALWHLRDSIPLAERALGPALQHDISVPVARMPDFIRDVEAAVVARFAGASTLSFGHLGDGNVHCHVRPPAGSDAAAWVRDYGAAASEAVYALATSMGGSISAEHGIGRTKRALLARHAPPERIATLRALKAALDPNATLNPGVLIP